MEKMTLQEKKALAYDISIKMQRYQNTLAQLQQDIHKEEANGQETRDDEKKSTDTA